MDHAFEFIKEKRGIATETSYPYAAADGTCDASKVDFNVAYFTFQVNFFD